MKLQDIDVAISKQLDLLQNEVKCIELVEICEFTLDEAGEKIPWDDLVHKGIYLFEIKNNHKFTSFDLWIENFKNIWESDKYRRHFTPNTRKVRINAHKELNDWIPLYIGKSRNVGRRVHEHLYKELHKTTFALKLQARTNLKNHIFRLKAIRIDVQNYDSIVPKVEWQLRNRINPIIGKQ
jgi:hypothetical protein